MLTAAQLWKIHITNSDGSKETHTYHDRLLAEYEYDRALLTSPKFCELVCVFKDYRNNALG
jgi:hypothetical protein